MTEMKEESAANKENHKYYLRFPLSYRVQHIILVLSFFTLIITGLPLLFPGSKFLRAIFIVPDIFVLRGVIHRIAAAALMLLGAFHVLFVIFSDQGNKDVRAIMPRWSDIGKGLRSILFNLGVTGDPPEYGRFRPIEKFQYIATAAAVAVMIGTGVIIWFPDLSMMLLPKWVMDVAITVHGLGAVLVFSTLILWHIYTVHFGSEDFPMSRVWLDGKISEEKMKKTHSLEHKNIREAEQQEKK